jgi:hypothetical protein
MHTLIRIRRPDGQPLGEEGDFLVGELAWLRPHCLALHEDGIVLVLANHEKRGSAADTTTFAMARQTIEISRRIPIQVTEWRLPGAKAYALIGTLSIALEGDAGATIVPSLEWDVAKAATAANPSAQYDL